MPDEPAPCIPSRPCVECANCTRYLSQVRHEKFNNRWDWQPTIDVSSLGWIDDKCPINKVYSNGANDG